MKRIAVKFLFGLGVLALGFWASRVIAQQGAVSPKVGVQEFGGVVVPSAQVVGPGVSGFGGERVKLGGRPVDIVRRASDGMLFVKNSGSIQEIDPKTRKVIAVLAEAHGASLHGLALTPDGKSLLSTDAASSLHVFDVSSGLLERGTVTFENASVGGAAYPCGVAVTADGASAYVCLSRSNQVAKVDLQQLKVVQSVNVAPAPYDVAISGDSLVVTCWGRTPEKGSLSSPSSGTQVAIDERGIATGGTVCFLDLSLGNRNDRLTGHQPSQIAITTDGYALIPTAGEDRIEVWDVAHRSLAHSLRLKPDGLDGLGIAPNALALSEDQKTVYVACGGLNAVAVISRDGQNLRPAGYLATDWYPLGVAVTKDELWAVNAKGIGSRAVTNGRYNVYSFQGTATRYDLPIHDLAGLSKQTLEQATKLFADVVVPSSSPLHQPSPIQHVFYIIKENRTYDQILGDVKEGDGDPSLVEFGEKYTPNIHALARDFALLDNFYCNGVNSADGHAWATEGNASSYFERSFGGFTRSYPFVVDDPIAPNRSGFIWNDALRHGKTFWNYGESDYAGSKARFKQNLADLKAGKITEFAQNIPVSDLRKYSQPDYPGWNLEIPDEVRASRFIADFKKREASGTVPNLSIIYLPEDHTGASVSPGTCVADNDYGVGLVVEAISHSKVWGSSAIFVVEDDAQAGSDHVDGHRSPCLVISPFTVRHRTISAFYSQDSVLHTIEQILGLPPMNRMDAIAPIMTEVFEGPVDLRPYDAISPKVAAMPTPDFMRHVALDFSKPDQADPKILNRLIWRAMRPGEPYPWQFEGGHGRGLAARGLKLDAATSKKDDD